MPRASRTRPVVSFRFDPRDIGKAQEREIARIGGYRVATNAWHIARVAYLDASRAGLEEVPRAVSPGDRGHRGRSGGSRI